MSMTVSVRVAHLSAGKAKGQRYHDTRQRTPGYVDQERTADNSQLVAQPTEAKLRAMCEERRAQRGMKRQMKSNAAILTSGIITFGKDAQQVIRDLPPALQNSLYKATAERIAAELNTDVVSLTVHRDESAPHAHFGLLAVDRSGKPLSKTLDPKRLQDIAGEVYKTLGIQRGTPKAERLAKGEDMAKVVHRSVAELHRDLPAELEAQRQEVQRQRAAAAQQLEAIQKSIEAEQAKAEKNARLMQEQEAKLAAGKVSEEQAQKRVATYERREAEARAKVEALEAQARDLQAKLQPIEQDLAKQHPMPTPPQAQRVEAVVKDGFFKQERATMDVVTAKDFEAYKLAAEIRQQNLIQQAAQAEARRQADAKARADAEHQSQLRGKLIEAIARSPLAEKLAEHVPALGKWIEHVRGLDAKEQARQQQRQRGYEMER